MEGRKRVLIGSGTMKPSRHPSFFCHQSFCRSSHYAFVPSLIFCPPFFCPSSGNRLGKVGDKQTSLIFLPPIFLPIISLRVRAIPHLFVPHFHVHLLLGTDKGLGCGAAVMPETQFFVFDDVAM